MSASLPVHHTSAETVWKLFESTFGLDREGKAVARPHKKSWLAFFKKHMSRQEASVMVQAWLLRLCWLRRMEIWLTEIHQDSSYFFLDEAHIDDLGDVENLLTSAKLEKNARSEAFNKRFPLLPRFPVPQWFSKIKVLPVPIEPALQAIRMFGIDDVGSFGKQPESPKGNIASAGPAGFVEGGNLLNPFALDGSLESGMLRKQAASHIPDESYSVTSGPGGYRRALPAQQAQWEMAMQGIHKQSRRLFAVAPDPLAADRWQYHLALTCVEAFHFCHNQDYTVSELPAFLHQIRIGESLKSSLDIRQPVESLLPNQPARLGIWRTALGRFHRVTNEEEREEARSLLADLPRHFRAPLRREGPAWRRLQKLLKIQQESQNLFADGESDGRLQESIEEARREFRNSNLQAFEWRYAFPEVLDVQTADFQGFDSMQMLIPEMLLEKQEHLLLAWVQLVWRLLKPGGRLQIWLPDDIMRRNEARPCFSMDAPDGKNQ